MKNQFRGGCLIASILTSGYAHAETPKVLASIAPVHSLVSAVMAGVGQPELLVPATASDHDFALRPSDLRKIAGADLVIWIGESLESYLLKPIETERVADLQLIDAPGIDPQPFTSIEESVPEGAKPAEESHEMSGDAVQHAPEGNAHAEEGEHKHAHSGLDPHVWLDPIRAQAIVGAVAEKLAELDPENAARYQRNADDAVASLSALDAEIKGRLTALSAKPFITFHDGYSYFVKRYGLRQVGQLTVDPEQRAGAASVRALRDEVAAEGVTCAFAEPQFDAGVIETLAGETGMRIGVLDAIGADLQPGPSLYSALLRKNTEAFEACLAPVS
ncbi:MAG: zinc ABC transporter substrate-binding protein [Pseudomonadota bacterium]|nr:zinc ABC transporter substrate-binding protein [Pseudomonadota bacterium]